MTIEPVPNRFDCHRVCLPKGARVNQFKISSWKAPHALGLTARRHRCVDVAQVQVLCSLVLFGMAHCALLSIIFSELSESPTGAAFSEVLMTILRSPRRMGYLFGEMIVLAIMIFLRTPPVAQLLPLFRLSV
jgi:hypothetical protein